MAQESEHIPPQGDDSLAVAIAQLLIVAARHLDVPDITEMALEEPDLLAARWTGLEERWGPDRQKQYAKEVNSLGQLIEVAAALAERDKLNDLNERAARSVWRIGALIKGWTRGARRSSGFNPTDIVDIVSDPAPGEPGFGKLRPLSANAGPNQNWVRIRGAVGVVVWRKLVVRGWNPDADGLRESLQSDLLADRVGGRCAYFDAAGYLVSAALPEVPGDGRQLATLAAKKLIRIGRGPRGENVRRFNERLAGAGAALKALGFNDDAVAEALVRLRDGVISQLAAGGADD